MTDSLIHSRDDALARLQTLPSGATVLILGGIDTGKTTFVREAALARTQAGQTVAVVDCDLGQSEIGPPGTVGCALALPGTEFRSLRDLPLLASYFVGATSPARHGLDVCVGACQMARIAKKQRPDLLLVDTCGLIAGGFARAFKRRLAELLLPTVVMALTRNDELDALLSAFAHLDAPQVWRVAPAPDVARKTPAARSTRRAARFLAAFANAQPITLDWEAVSLLGTSLGAGLPLEHHLRAFLAESLGGRVLHAERQPDGGLYIVVHAARSSPSGLASVESYFKTKSVTIVAAQKFAHLLVGLVSASGALLDLGLIQRIDFDRRTITLLTPCRRPAAVAQVWLGALRLRPDGRELGELRPGEL